MLNYFYGPLSSEIEKKNLTVWQVVRHSRQVWGDVESELLHVQLELSLLHLANMHAYTMCERAMITYYLC